MSKNKTLSAAKSAKNDEFYTQYADIGHHLLFGDNAATNTFAHNQLNQMVGRAAPSAPPTSFTNTPEGGLASDGTWFYAYDAEDQLLSVTSASLTNGTIRVLNTYDYRRRRTSKTVQRLNSTIPPPPSPPIGVEEWQTLEMRTFVYDDWNLIHETIYMIDGNATNITEVQYFWDLDLSDSLQGAGGVGGLLAVSCNGQFYFPTYDNNGNVTKYIDESGNIVAAYEYDDFGRTISQSGPLADFFRHRFSTKYYDSETGLYYYGIRFYAPNWRIWLNRDPIEETGWLIASLGTAKDIDFHEMNFDSDDEPATPFEVYELNSLYGFLANNPLSETDFLGSMKNSNKRETEWTLDLNTVEWHVWNCDEFKKRGTRSAYIKHFKNMTFRNYPEVVGDYFAYQIVHEIGIDSDPRACWSCRLRPFKLYRKTTGKRIQYLVKTHADQIEKHPTCCQTDKIKLPAVGWIKVGPYTYTQ